MLKVVVVLILGVALVAGLAVVAGAWRWSTETRDLRARLAATRSPGARSTVEFADLAELPEPVQRYLRAVLREGQPRVPEAHIQHRGTFNLSETAEQWKPFTSDQQVITTPPGFDWNGRIAFLPGVSVRVHDAYVAGEGILYASLLGLITLANQRGTPELARGELMRYLAESVWYPTVLLPGQGVTWAAVDAQTADATLEADGIAVTLRFHFGEDGLVETVSTPARGRAVAGVIVPTPWEGRFWDYAEQSGMMVPLQGEVAWMLPAESKTYWRGTVTAITYP